MRELSPGEKHSPEFASYPKLSVALDGQLYPWPAQSGSRPESFPTGLHFAAHRNPKASEELQASQKLQMPLAFTEVVLQGKRFHERCLICIGNTWYLANPGDLLLSKKIELQGQKSYDSTDFYFPISFWRAEKYLVRTNKPLGDVYTFNAQKMTDHGSLASPVFWQEHKVKGWWPQDDLAKNHLQDIREGASERKIACCFIEAFRVSEEYQKPFDPLKIAHTAWEESCHWERHTIHRSADIDELRKTAQIGLSGIALYLETKMPALLYCKGANELKREQVETIRLWAAAAKAGFEKFYGRCRTVELEVRQEFIDGISRGNVLLQDVLGHALESPKPETKNVVHQRAPRLRVRLHP